MRGSVKSRRMKFRSRSASSPKSTMSARGGERVPGEDVVGRGNHDRRRLDPVEDAPQVRLHLLRRAPQRPCGRAGELVHVGHASKHGVLGLTKSAALEYALDGSEPHASCHGWSSAGPDAHVRRCWRSPRPAQSQPASTPHGRRSQSARRAAQGLVQPRRTSAVGAAGLRVRSRCVRSRTHSVASGSR